MNENDKILSKEEVTAIKNVEEYAKCGESQAKAAIQRLLKCYKLEYLDIDVIICKIFNLRRITINFHPDLIMKNGNTTLEGLLDEGLYHNQFITEISSGHLSFQRDRNRDSWEGKIFGEEIALPSYKKPKYGGLNIFNYLDGASPKYGSCYLELTVDIVKRCTFMIADTNGTMNRKGTNDSFYVLFFTLIIEIIKTGKLFGKSYSSLLNFFKEIDVNGEKIELGANILDYGLEAQIFGAIDLRRDVERIYIDESYKETRICSVANELARRYDIRIEWIPMRKAPTEAMLCQCGSDALVDLINATRMQMPSDCIDAMTLGEMRRILILNPEYWGKYGDEVQWNRQLRELWKFILLWGKCNTNDETRII